MFFLCFDSSETSSFHLGCSKLGRGSLLNAQTAEVAGEPEQALREPRQKNRGGRPAAQRPGQSSLCTTQLQGAESTPGPPGTRGRGGGVPLRAPAPWRCGKKLRNNAGYQPPSKKLREHLQDKYPQTPQGPHSGPSSAQWAPRTPLPVSASSPHCCFPQRVAGSASRTLVQTLCPAHSWSQGQGPVPGAAGRGGRPG